MLVHEQDIERQAALDAAIRVCAAARTAPKARGIDHLHTMVLTGEEKDGLAERLEEMGKAQGLAFYERDAGNLRAAQSIALIGTTEKQRGLGRPCGYCHFDGCEACAEAGGVCVFDAMDLGIALGSAAATAADLRVDTRIMYSIGKAALDMGLMGEDVKIIMGLPISVSGKSPFFDRKPKPAK